MLGARHDRPRAEGRRGAVAHPHRRAGPRTSTPCASPPARPTLLLGCDMVVAASRRGDRQDAAAARPARWSTAYETTTGDFTRNPDLQFPRASCADAIVEAVGRATRPTSSTRRGLATALMGDSIATNLFMLGYAWQKGLVPVSREAHRAGDRAERRRGRVEQARLRLGPPRRGRPRRGRARRAPRGADRRSAALSQTLDEIDRAPRRVPHRLPGRRLRRALRRPRRQACATPRRRSAGGTTRLDRGGRALSLQADGLQGRVRGRAALHRRRLPERASTRSSRATTRSNFHLAPPLSPSAIRRPASCKKRTFGPWMLTAFRVLAKLKGLRGTPLDIFGRSAERRMERQLIADYERADRGAPREPHARQPPPRRRDRLDPRAHPRLRPRQGSAPQDGEGARGRAAGAVPGADAGAIRPGGGVVTRVSPPS